LHWIFGGGLVSQLMIVKFRVAGMIWRIN
jgi:hypothetical protein